MKHRPWLVLKMTILIIILLSLSSCGYKDIDKRSFVVTIGVDKAESDDKKYKVLLKIAIPKADVKAGQEDFIISELESNSITQAVRMIKTLVPQELDFSHARAIIFGEDVMQEDIQELLDWFIRRRDIQKIAWVGIARPNAEELLKLKRKTERLPSNALFLSFGNTGTESAYIVSEYLFDFRKRLTEKGLDPILPIIEMKGAYFEINKAAIFDNDKIRMTLSEEETKILNVLLNRLSKADIRIMKKGDEEQESFFIAASQLNTSYKLKIDSNNNLIIKVNLQIEGIIEEALEDMSEEKIVESKERAEKQIKEKVIDLLKILREEELDPIGFGLDYRAQSFNKDDWEEWQKLYPEAEFEVNVKVKIEGTGLLNN